MRVPAIVKYRALSSVLRPAISVIISTSFRADKSSICECVNTSINLSSISILIFNPSNVTAPPTCFFT